MTNFNDFKRIFRHINKLCWENNVSDFLTYKIAYNHFMNTKHNYTKNNNIIRLIGQSGSGKTTQLLPTAKSIMKSSSLTPFIACVRDYATLHPNYEKLKNEFGESEIREKTNCFALKCMTVNLILAIKNNFDIIFEVTLLSKQYENFILKFLNSNKYNILNLCLAVNIKYSNMFIEKRQNNVNSNEGKRVVYNSSSQFFYKNLNKSLKYYTKKTPYNRIIIWSIFKELPIYDNILKNSYKAFISYQIVKNLSYLDEKLLLNSKLKYVSNYVKLN